MPAKMRKFASGWGSAPEPAGETYDASQTHIRLGMGYSNGSLVLKVCGIQSRTLPPPVGRAGYGPGQPAMTTEIL